MTPKQHWLVRPATIAKLWRVGLIVLALTVVAELTYEPHPHFSVDGWPAFYAVYGFVTCVLMIFFAKFLGVFLKRSDTYYDETPDSGPEGGQ